MKKVAKKAKPKTKDETLYSALVAEGNKDQAKILTGKGKKLTKQDIINHLNGSSSIDISGGLEEELNEISIMRVKKGQPLLPWQDEEIKKILAAGPERTQGVNVGGGAW